MDVKITSVIEKIVAIVAPHRCLGCGNENNILCTVCRYEYIKVPDSFCVVCAKPTKNWQLCVACRRASGLTHAWVGGHHEGILEGLIKRYKFERAKAAYSPLAQVIMDRLPAGDWQVVPVPTAPSRVRQRGYDQVLLIAREVARQRQLPLDPLLRRAHDQRQVGASRTLRLQQMQHAFYVSRHIDTTRPILLIDDVCTTGATLRAAAHCLRAAGAKNIQAAVCAWQAPTL